MGPMLMGGEEQRAYRQLGLAQSDSSSTVHLGNLFTEASSLWEKELEGTWKGVRAPVKDSGGQGRIPVPASQLRPTISCMAFVNVAEREKS